MSLVSSCYWLRAFWARTVNPWKLPPYLRCEENFCTNIEHPCVQELMAEGVLVDSFDDVYATEPSFEAVYERITELLRIELQKGIEVIYAVPGHPMVAEMTIQLIEEKLAQEYEVVIHPAMSFVEEIFRVLKFDPIDGVLIRNYDALKDVGLDGTGMAYHSPSV